MGYSFLDRYKHKKIFELLVFSKVL